MACAQAMAPCKRPLTPDQVLRARVEVQLLGLHGDACERLIRLARQVARDERLGGSEVTCVHVCACWCVRGGDAGGSVPFGLRGCPQ